MSNFRRGQIWLVNFDPSFGREYKKMRPALIIQNDKYIESGNLLTVIPLSSQLIKKTEPDILLRKDANNRLMTDSVLKINQISSFDKRRFIKFIGTANAEAMEKVMNHISIFLKEL